MAGIGSCAQSHMFQIEIVITPEPWNKTIWLWVWHTDTVLRVKQLIEDGESIPQDVQRLIFQGGILDDRLPMGHLYSADMPPRLFLDF